MAYIDIPSTAAANTSANYRDIPSSGINTNAGYVAIPPANTGMVTPPFASSLRVWWSGLNYDGSGNTTITSGNEATSIVNLGTLGGVLSRTGTGPNYNKTANNLWELTYPGADRRLVNAFSAISQPFVFFIIVRRNTVSTQGLVDGLSLHRAVMFDNGGTQLNIGSNAFVSAASPTVTSKYNCVIGYFNGGPSSSTLDLNFGFPDTGAYLATGDTGIQTVTGITIGALNDGSSPLNGVIVDGMFWQGVQGTSAPTSQQIWDYVTITRGPGWPCATLSQYSLSPLSTVSFQLHGGDLLDFIGDSITQGISTSPWQNPYITSVNAALITPITNVNKGVGGNVIAQIDTRWATDVTAVAPQACICQAGVNDLFAKTPLDEFIASWQSISTKWTTSGRAANKLALMGIFCQNEFYPDPIAIQVNAYNNAINYVANLNGHAYIDVRTPQQAFEAANNTPPPGNSHDPGPLGQTLATPDGKHPSAAVGCPIFSTAAFNKTTLTG
jgi:hypothetical protein